MSFFTLKKKKKDYKINLAKACRYKSPSQVTKLYSFSIANDFRYPHGQLFIAVWSVFLLQCKDVLANPLVNRAGPKLRGTEAEGCASEDYETVSSVP